MVQWLRNVDLAKCVPEVIYVEGQCQCVSDGVFMGHSPCFVVTSIFVDSCCEVSLQLIA